ncbi:hypothetical protein JCM11251_000855 [Rhodosporidiobolus azoricus]
MSTISPFAARPPPPPASPTPDKHQDEEGTHSFASTSTTPPPVEAAPPALPPKLPPPPPPPPPSAPRSAQPSSSSSSFIVPISTASPSPTSSRFRHRSSLDASNSSPLRDSFPPPSPHITNHSSGPSSSTTPTRAYHHARNGSRSTSVDFGYSDFEIVDSLGPEHERRGGGEGRTLLLPFARTNKDLPDLDGVEFEEGDEAEAELLGSPSHSRRRRRGKPPLGTAEARRKKIRTCLIVSALLAVLFVLAGALGGTEERREGVKKKVQDAWGGVKDTFAGGAGGAAAGVAAAGGGGEGLEGKVGTPVEEGGDGDWVRLENGTVVQYRNSFGGRFSSSPDSLSARATDDTPPLSEEWDFEQGRTRGVNLGGWLTLEPFITPSLFDPFLTSPYPCGPAVDEWTLSLNLRAEGGGGMGGQERLEEVLRRHYETFITELDFLAIAAAGLNWVRLPVPYWAIRTWGGASSEGGAGEGKVKQEGDEGWEPFLEGVAWEYVLRALHWARKYGLRINFDLHSVPGSQNGWNHSGRLGRINVLHGKMGRANAERALDYVRVVGEWTAREEIRKIVPMCSILNEPMLAVIGPQALRSFYLEAYETVRNATGYGKGNGPFLAFHDGFKGTRRWYNFLEERPSSKSSLNGLDRVALDSHRYLAFAEPDLREVRDQVMKPCMRWAPEFNKTATSFGIAMSGEFALAINDCGRFLNNVFEGTRLEGTFPTKDNPMYPPSAPEGTCDFWEDYSKWDDDLKAALRDLALAQMDTFQNWFYWTWKTAPSTLHNPHLYANPLWSYSLGLAQGWIPRDPREAHDFCFRYPDSPAGLAHATSAATDGGTMDDGQPRRYPKRVPLKKLEAWKVGDETPDSTEGGVGRISTQTKEREKVAWPPLEFDVPGGEYGAGGLPVAGLPRYARTGRGVVLPGPFEEGSDRRPRLATEEEMRNGRVGRWFEEIEGCEYPASAWNAIEVEFEQPWCPTAAVLA